MAKTKTHVAYAPPKTNHNNVVTIRENLLREAVSKAYVGHSGMARLTQNWRAAVEAKCLNANMRDLKSAKGDAANGR